MTKDIFTIAEVIDQAYDILGVYGTREYKKIPTGIEPIDRRMGGISSGKLWVLGARSSVGKTSILLNMAHAAAREGYRVGFISLEDGPSVIGGKFQSRFSGVPLIELEANGSAFGGLSSIKSALSACQQLPIHVGFARHHSLGTLASIITQLRDTAQPEILFIDYLTALLPESRGEPRSFYNEVLSYLRELTLTYNLPVVLGSQITRNSSAKTDNYEVYKRELSETGSIEQRSDLIMLAWADDENNRYLKVAKNKICGSYLPRMRICHNMNTEVMTFEEMT